MERLRYSLTCYRMLLCAVIATYRWRSLSFFARRQKTMLFTAFALVPLASVPELFAAPILALGDTSLPTIMRVVLSVALGLAWSLWNRSQSEFLIHLDDFPSLSVGMAHRTSLILTVARWGILGWPLLMTTGIVLIVDTGGRGPASIGALAGIILMSSLIQRIVASTGELARRVGRIHASVRSVLLWRAAQDVLDLRDPALAIRHATAIGSLFCGQAISSNNGGDAAAFPFVVLGSITAIFVLRSAASLAEQRHIEAAPILMGLQGQKILGAYRVFLLSAVGVVASAVVSAIAHASGGLVHRRLLLLAATALVSVTFVLCRWLTVPRRVEIGCMATVCPLVLSHALAST